MQQTRDEILKQGFAEIRLRRTGTWQRHKFMIVREKTAFGEVSFLVAQFPNLPKTELVRIADEIQLPVKSGDNVAFPKGKMTKDFVTVSQTHVQ